MSYPPNIELQFLCKKIKPLIDKEYKFWRINWWNKSNKKNKKS